MCLVLAYCFSGSWLGERCGGEKKHVDSTVSKKQQSQKPKSGGAFPPAAAHGVQERGGTQVPQ